jgi:hypothetical protein
LFARIYTLKHINMTKTRSPRIVSGTSGANIVEILNKESIEFNLRSMQNYKPPYFIDTSLEVVLCPKGLRNLLGEPDKFLIGRGLLVYYARYDDKGHSIIGDYERINGLLVERTRIYTRHR